jgi:hypothetical protein
MTTQLEHDTESQHSARSSSRFRHILDQPGVTPAVLRYKNSDQGIDEAPFVVDYLSEDPYNPLLFPRWKKWSIGLTMAVATLAVSFASSAFSGGIKEVMADFDTSSDVAVLGVSLFGLGFAVGPLLWAPLIGK